MDTIDLDLRDPSSSGGVPAGSPHLHHPHPLLRGPRRAGHGQSAAAGGESSSSDQPEETPGPVCLSKWACLF